MHYKIKILITKELKKRDFSFDISFNIPTSQQATLRMFLVNAFSDTELTVGQIKQKAREKIGNFSFYTVENELVYFGKENKADDDELLSDSQVIEYKLITK